MAPHCPVSLWRAAPSPGGVRPSRKGTARGRDLRDLSCPSCPSSPSPRTGQCLGHLGDTGCQGMRDAEGCRRQPQKARSTQILNPAKENLTAMRFSPTCSGPSSLGCLCAIYLCTGAPVGTLEVAPGGCRTAARAALAPWGDRSQDDLRFWLQDGYQIPSYSHPPAPGTSRSETLCPRPRHPAKGRPCAAFKQAGFNTAPFSRHRGVVFLYKPT